MSRMYERLEDEQIALGVIMPVHGPEWLEIFGYVGFDFTCLDMMVSSLTWSEIAGMILAAKRYDVTPWLRLSAYPWEADEFDSSLPAQVLRALSIGAECVLASVNRPEHVERLLQPLSNAHRRFYIQQGEHQGGGRTEAQRQLDSLEPEQRVFPCIESLAMAKRIDDILELPRLQMVYLGMGDLSRELGHPSDDRHPEVREFVKSLAAKARNKGVVVCANTLAYKQGVELTEETADGVESLVDLGIRVIMVPRATMVVQRTYEKMMREIKAKVPTVYS